MEFYEQQSTYNFNMPIHELMCAGKAYDRFIYTEKLNRYGRKLMALPIPKLVVFYNGTDDKPDEVVLNLSDAFREEIRNGILSKEKGLTEEELQEEVEKLYGEADPDISVRVRMLNINYGHNKALLSACKPLEEYSWFVAKVRENNQADSAGKTPGIEIAIEKAIDEMPDSFMIKELIMSNRAEVKEMCLTEYNEEEVMEMMRKEAREEAQKQTEEAKKETEEAKKETEEAKKETEEAKKETEEAQKQIEEVLKQNEELQKRLEEALKQNEEIQKHSRVIRSNGIMNKIRFYIERARGRSRR